MSLLLDALKRAEQAKQEGGDTQSEPTALDSLNYEPVSPTPSSEPAPPPLITRDRLPDISQSLEILADDLPPPLLRRAKDSALRASPKADKATAEAQQAARRLFEAKETQANPKTPFYIALGVLGMVGLSGVAYFWYQMQPRTPAAQAIVIKQSPPQQALVTQPLAPASVPINSTETIVPPLAASTTFNEPRARVVLNDSPPPLPAPKSVAAVPIEKAGAGPSFNKSSIIGLSLTQQAYAAFERGDLTVAREQYQAALSQDPLDRDALLGLAALDARSGRYEEAQARYIKVLEADPRNPNAQAAMIALRGQGDPVAAESRLKNLIAQQPNAHFLNFALGNLYAEQNRWSEAQQSYFKAYVADPSNADYAFNLAVGLDHLRQAKPAIDYYQKALALSLNGPGNFNRAQAETRLRELAQSNAQ